MHDYLFWCIWCVTTSEDEEARFREPKIVYVERELVGKAIPSSTEHKSKKAVAKLALSWQQNFVCLLETFVVQERSNTATTEQSDVTAALTDSRKQTISHLNTLGVNGEGVGIEL